MFYVLEYKQSQRRFEPATYTSARAQANHLIEQAKVGIKSQARARKERPKGQKGGPLGGIEAARTTMSVLRQMYSWAIDEEALKRKDNPASRMQKNLPKQKRGETVLTLREARGHTS